jgi:hypothetical protein
MSLEQNITVEHTLFAGEDKQLKFEILAAGADPASPVAAVQNVAGWTFAWTLRAAVRSIDPHRAQATAIAVAKTSASGIAIEGTYNASRALNTQRVVVTIADTDTETLAGGTYVQALKRMDDGSESVLCHGTVALLKAATT